MGIPYAHLMNLSTAVYQTEWQRIARSVRRFVLLLMLRSQRPFHVSASAHTHTHTLTHFHCENHFFFLNNFQLGTRLLHNQVNE